MEKKIEKTACKNCIHYQLCVHIFRKAKQKYPSLPFDEGPFFADASDCDFYADNRIYRKQAWISVEERLPECKDGGESEAVLFLTSGGRVDVGYFGRGSVYHDVYFRHYRTFVGRHASTVTHWMPLPPLPKGE